MNKKENLYYALGHLAYAVAMADGEIQKEERQMVHDIVTKEAQKRLNPEINISEIIFSILHKQAESVKVTYERAIHELEISKEHLTKEVENEFINILYLVAEAFPPVETAEQAVINNFRNYLSEL